MGLLEFIGLLGFIQLFGLTELLGLVWLPGFFELFLYNPTNSMSAINHRYATAVADLG